MDAEKPLLLYRWVFGSSLLGYIASTSQQRRSAASGVFQRNATPGKG
jgi:hypothetical protein